MGQANNLLITVGPAPSGEVAKQRQLQYDPLGHLTSVCELSSPGGSGACGQYIPQNGFFTAYTVDPLGNITQTVQGSNTSTPETRTYQYDALSRLVSETNPESGTTTYNYDSSPHCAASSPGDLIWKSDAVGNLTCYNYDALHRLTISSYGGPYQPSTPSHYFVYDSATVNGAAMSNGGGRMVEAYTITTGGKITDLGFSYTKRGEVSDTYEMTPHSGGYYHLTASYFPNGQINTFASAGLTPSLTYNVDGEGRPWTMSASSGQNPVTSTSYNTASQATSVTYGSGDSDSFSFDPNTQLPLGYTINVGTKAQTASITQNLNHTMRQLSITDTIFSNENQTCNFGYDEFARLTSANCGSVWGADYAYDIFGNMNKTMIAGSPGTSFIPTYNTSNHYATLPAGTPSYDNNGNLLNDSFHTYSWDNEGSPVTVDGNPLTYDALYRRVEYYSSSLGYVQYLWAPYDATRNLVIVAPAGPQYEIPLPGGSQAILGSSGITEYRRANWQGSQVIDSTTSQTATIDGSFSPYGEHYAENNYLGFFGGNLSIYPFFMDGYAATWRLYHYDQNRWISPDPAGLSAVDPSDPQTWNRYSYARGNPLGAVDPTGLCSDYDPSCTGPIFYAFGVSCGSWWNIWCWLNYGNGTSPLPPSQYQASNAGVNPNSGNPGAQSGSAGQGGGAQQQQPDWAKAGKAALSCAADHYGLTALAAGAGAFGLPVPKSWLGLAPGFAGASEYTSVAGATGFRLFGAAEPRIGLRILGTTRLFGIIGRAAPGISAALFAYDAAAIAYCTYQSVK